MIIFTKHARERMQERKISKKDVEECILRPMRVSMDSGRIRRFQKVFKHGTLEVVVECKGNHFVIITAYPL